jgi:alpha-galactosidase
MKKLSTSSLQPKGINILFVLLFFIFGACENGNPQNGEAQNEVVAGKMENGNIIAKYNDMMYSKVISKKEKTPLMKNFQSSEYIKINSVNIRKFRVVKHSSNHFSDSLGTGTKLILGGNSINKKYPVQKRLIVKAYDRFPNMIITQVSYKNMGNDDLKIDKWVNNSYQIQTQNPVDTSEIAFWSYQSGTYPTRNDWIRPIKNGYYQENYMGMNASDYGGGTPVTDIWRRDVGLAIGDISMVSHLVSLPVSAPNIKKGVHLSIEYDFSNVSQKKVPHIIKPGQSLTTLKTFAEIHTGDFFQALREYSNLMKARGMSFPKPPKSAYQPVWCAWGYGRTMHLQQVLNTIPVAKELGFKWVVLDDGWQKAEGNWRPNSKFNDISMEEFVRKVHDAGMKAKLWWSPMSADAGSPIFEKHPEYLIINKKGNLEHISWWNSYYLDPADPGVIAYTKKLVNKFINKWGFDGLKIDGQFLNQVPPDYSPVSNLKYPEESVEKLPSFFKMIYKTAEKDDSQKAVVEICPCGTAASFYIMSAMNQPVASDPKDSWQVRQRGKVYKALIGSSVPFYGDHVELSNNGDDFASTVGIGGVPGSKFTIKEEAPKGSYGYRNVLTPSKKKKWKKWLSIYNNNMLSKGKYLGSLYDIGFGKPEGHAIFKNGNIYYAFYIRRGNNKQWNGKIHLKGLKKNKKYKITDYVNDKKYGEVSSPNAAIQAKFRDHLLLKATPVSTK